MLIYTRVNNAEFPDLTPQGLINVVTDMYSGAKKLNIINDIIAILYIYTLKESTRITRGSAHDLVILSISKQLVKIHTGVMRTGINWSSFCYAQSLHCRLVIKS